MALIAMVMGYAFHNSGIVSFAAGFLGAGLLWLGMAYYMDSATQSILTEKVNKLFPLNVFILMTFVGGLVGGFAALTGALMRGKKLARY
jgi:cell division protein FtsX